MYFSFDKSERIADKFTNKGNFDNSIAMIDWGIANFYFRGHIFLFLNQGGGQKHTRVSNVIKKAISKKTVIILF